MKKCFKEYLPYVQHRNGTIQLYVDLFMGQLQLFCPLYDKFTLFEKAEGIMLDYYGMILGIPRALRKTDSSYNVGTGKKYDKTDGDVDVAYWGGKDIVGGSNSGLLPDIIYREILRARIKKLTKTPSSNLQVEILVDLFKPKKIDIKKNADGDTVITILDPDPTTWSFINPYITDWRFLLPVEAGYKITVEIEVTAKYDDNKNYDEGLKYGN